MVCKSANKFTVNNPFHYLTTLL